jgi:hypothetical protein
MHMTLMFKQYNYMSYIHVYSIQAYEIIDFTQHYYQIMTHEICDVPTYLGYIPTYLHYINIYLFRLKTMTNCLLT